MPGSNSKQEQELDDYKVDFVRDRNKQYLTYNKVAQALVDCDGYIMKTAIKLGVSYKRLTEYIRTHTKLKELIQDTTEALLDLAENKLRELILVGDKTAIIFHLKCKGAHRGWREDITFTGDGKEGEIIFKYDVVIPEGFKIVEDKKEEVAG